MTPRIWHRVARVLEGFRTQLVATTGVAIILLVLSGLTLAFGMNTEAYFTLFCIFMFIIIESWGFLLVLSWYGKPWPPQVARGGWQPLAATLRGLGSAFLTLWLSSGFIFLVLAL